MAKKKANIVKVKPLTTRKKPVMKGFSKTNLDKLSIKAPIIYKGITDRKIAANKAASKGTRKLKSGKKK